MTKLQHTFPKSLRLLTKGDFDRVFARKCSTADGLMVVYGSVNELDRTRLGMVVSRKYGGAVRRNRFKRLMREAFRLSRSELPVGLDLVVIPRRGAAAELDAVRASLTSIALRLQRKLARTSR